MGSSSTFIPQPSGPLGPLRRDQENMRDLAGMRSTPFGVVVPKYATPVTAIGFVAVPAAYGTQAQVVQVQTKADYYAIICALVFGFVSTGGAGPAPFPGDVTFMVDVDRPVGSLEGYPEKDYGAQPMLLGSLNGFPWPCDFRIENGEILRIKATPVANMGLGPGNWFTGALLGYEWPKHGFEG